MYIRQVLSYEFPVKESTHEKLSSLSCSDFYGKIYTMNNHYPVQVTYKEVFFHVGCWNFPV